MKFLFNHKSSLITLVLIFLTSTFESCRKFVQIPASPSLVSSDNVYGNDPTAISVLTGIYTDMSKGSIGEGMGSFTGLGSISLMAGLSADELDLFSGVTSNSYQSYYKNTLAVSIGGASAGFEFWAPLYKFIYRTNAAIEGLSSDQATMLTPSIKKQLIGEAKFLRAFFYFYLVNLYGDVPLALTTDYKVNAQMSREDKDNVYKQIIADLIDSKNSLSDNYLDATLLKNTIERVRPTKWTATALLARAYLFSGNYSSAETESTEVISNSSLFNISNLLTGVFLKNSNEAIWQLQPVTLRHNTEDAWIFKLPTSGPSNIVGASVYPSYLSKQLLNSFETNDLRKKNWIDSIVSTTDGKTYYYPTKYKSATLNAPVTEYLMVFRLAEQYLIRAEARALSGNIGGAQADLNVIRNRAGLGDTPASDQSSLLTAILNERMHELFSEWGHRWLDLKRTGKVDAIMSVVTPLKANGAPWQSYQHLYPIPLEALNSSLNLTQNPGYN